MSASRRRAVADKLHVVVASHKGGAGKTTLAVNLAAALAEEGRHVLVVDVDPQGAATAALGARAGETTIYDVLSGSGLGAAVVPTTAAGVDVVAATLDLAGAEVSLPRQKGWQSRLRQALEEDAGHYDAVVIDSAPGLGVLPFVALVAGNQVVVAATPTYLTLRALGQVVTTVEEAQAFNGRLRLLGVVPSIVGGRTLHRDEALEELDKRWPGMVLPALPRRVVFEDAAAAGRAVVAFSPRSASAAAVRAVAREVVARGAA